MITGFYYQAKLLKTSNPKVLVVRIEINKRSKHNLISALAKIGIEIGNEGNIY